MLSLAREMAAAKSGGGNSAKIRPPAPGFIPGMDVESAVENPPRHTGSEEKRIGDERWFEARDRRVCCAAAIVRGRAWTEDDPVAGAICAPADTPFPRRTAIATLPLRPWAKLPPAPSPTIATPAKPSRCAVVKPRPGQGKKFFHNRPAVHDWSKTPAGREPPGHWLAPDYCPEGGCAGSGFPFFRSGGSAAV